MEIRNLDELREKAKAAMNMAAEVVDALLGDDFIIASIPKPERKPRKKYVRKAKKVDPVPAADENPKAIMRKSRAKKNPFYDDQPPAAEV